MINRQALTNLNKVGEVTSRLKELEVALEFADLSKQRAEGEATLAKERAESATREVKRLELMVPSTCYASNFLFSIFYTSNFLFSIFYPYVHYLCRFIYSFKNHIFMCRICLDFCSFLPDSCGQLAAISEERDKLRKEHPTESDQSGMEKAIRELESIIHELKELISHKDTELNTMNERLSLETRKVKSLEREGDQLRSQVALLESKVRTPEITC